MTKVKTTTCTTSRLFLIFSSLIIFISQTPAAVGKTKTGSVCDRSWEKLIDKKIQLGYADFYDKRPKIEFMEISKAEFEGYEKAYRPHFDPNPSRVKSTPTNFTIPTAKATLTFNKEDKRFEPGVPRDGACWGQYLGYYPDLKLSLVSDSSVGESIGFAHYVLIDESTNVAYDLNAIGDYHGDTLPLFSPGQAFMAYYYNEVVSSQKQTTIALIQISGKPRRYEDHAGFELRDHFIDKLVWIDDQAFAIKMQRRVKSEADPKEPFKYFKTKTLAFESKSAPAN